MKILTNKKYEELLQEERKRFMEEHEEECNEYKTEIVKLYDRIHDLEDRQLRTELEDTLKDYDYAILVKDYNTLLWNNGKWDNSWVRISFKSNDYDEVPDLIIEK